MCHLDLEPARDTGVASKTVYQWGKQAGALSPLKALKALMRERGQLIDDAVALVTLGMSVPNTAATLGLLSVRCTRCWRKRVCLPNCSKSTVSPRGRKLRRSSE